MRRKAVVCGTKFGRFYLSAFRQPGAAFELAGIVGQGSARTTAAAASYGVPIYAGPDEVPDDVEVACVVIGSGVNGGPGAEIAQGFLKRGMHVLQEHPLLPAELQACYRAARSGGVQYAVNSHYHTLAPIRAMIAAARALSQRGVLSFVDASCSIQVAYALFDVLGHALGGTQPRGFTGPLLWDDPLAAKAASAMPYRSLEGVLAGVPVTLRVQNTLDPDDPDNFSHHLMRVVVGGAGGSLSLVDTHGPVLWSPRLHLPASAAHLAHVEDAEEAYLDLPTQSVIWDAAEQTPRDIYASLWPAAIASAMTAFDDRISRNAPPLETAQYDLAVCETWQHVTRTIGFPELRPGTDVLPHGADVLLEGRPGQDRKAG